MADIKWLKGRPWFFKSMTIENKTSIFNERVSLVLKTLNCQFKNIFRKILFYTSNKAPNMNPPNNY